MVGQQSFTRHCPLNQILFQSGRTITQESQQTLRYVQERILEFLQQRFSPKTAQVNRKFAIDSRAFRRIGRSWICLQASDLRWLCCVCREPPAVPWRLSAVTAQQPRCWLLTEAHFNGTRTAFAHQAAETGKRHFK